MVCAALGCGGSQPATPEAAPAGGAAAEPSGGSSTSSAPSAEKTSHAANEVHSDASGRRWVGKIPYDVFYEDPLAVVNNTQKVETAAAAPTAGTADTKAGAGTTEPPKPKDGGDKAASAAGDSDWKTIIPIRFIEAEAKKTRNRLTESLQSIGKYNGNYKEIQVEGAVLAAMGGIVTEHPEEISWKANAKHIRELGAQIEQGSQGLGKKSFDATQAAFEKLTAILDGSKPADLADVPEKAPFNEAADRAGLMKRMDRAFNWAKKNVTTEAIFKSSADEVTHEAAVLAALSKVIALPGYPSADEDQYKQHAQAMIDASFDMQKAVNNMDFKGYNDALSKIQKKCDECHTDYRFADN